MINAGFPLEHHSLQTATRGAGVALAWWANEPPGLVAVTGIRVIGGRQTSLSAFFLVVGWDLPVESETNLLLAVFLALGLAIRDVVYLGLSAALLVPYEADQPSFRRPSDRLRELP